MLFAFGSNGHGQLSLGHREDTHVPTPCRLPASFPAGCPRRIVAGGNHTLVLFSSGALYAAGDNAHGQCALPLSAGSAFASFHRVPEPDDGSEGWHLVSAGWEFSVLVSMKGMVYTCGAGPRGELGHGLEVASCALRRILRFSDVGIASLASGMAHTVAVLFNGEVWGWGAGRKGQLGLPADAKIEEPRRIELGHAAAEAACGREFTFVISPSGDRHTLLGSSRYGTKETFFHQGALQDWKKVGASWGGVCVLLSDGLVNAWGRNDRGQLPPPGLTHVRDIAVGSEHALAISGHSEAGGRRLYAWGWGEHGNCGRSRGEHGTGDVVGELFEVAVEGGSSVSAVGAGCATSWVWADE